MQRDNTGFKERERGDDQPYLTRERDTLFLAVFVDLALFPNNTPDTFMIWLSLVDALCACRVFIHRWLWRTVLLRGPGKAEQELVEGKKKTYLPTR